MSDGKSISGPVCGAYDVAWASKNPKLSQLWVSLNDLSPLINDVNALFCYTWEFLRSAHLLRAEKVVWRAVISEATDGTVT